MHLSRLISLINPRSEVVRPKGICIALEVGAAKLSPVKTVLRCEKEGSLLLPYNTSIIKLKVLFTLVSEI